MKALVGAFNQEKALVGAFSVIVQLHQLIDLRHYPVYYLCCSEQDGEGLWWTRQYPEEVWVAALQGMVDRWRV